MKALTSEQIDVLKTNAEKATPGPWRWFGHLKIGMYLATTHSGRLFVMDFVRQGMRGAQPRFQPGDGIGMVKAEEIAVKEVDYRDDIVDIDNPDARHMALASPEVVLALLEERERLLRVAEAAKVVLANCNAASDEVADGWDEQGEGRTRLMEAIAALKATP